MRDSTPRRTVGPSASRRRRRGEESSGIWVFISHASDDKRIAKALVELIRAAINLEASRIRCTSVDGYRLPVGSDNDERLREELLVAKAFVGILTPKSRKSTYVLFEMGARWGRGRSLFPLMAARFNPGDLRGPVAGLNALDGADRNQLQQLVGDIATQLGMNTEPPQVYAAALEKLVRACRKGKARRAARPTRRVRKAQR